MSNTPTILSRLRRGDPDALAEFLESRRPQLLSYIQRIMADRLKRRVDPQDVHQEVSTEALRTLAETDLSSRDPFGWLCGIAQRRVIDAHRRHFGAQKRSGDREVGLDAAAADKAGSNARLIDLLVVTMTTPSQAFARDERQQQLQQALAALGDEQREALRLRYVEGLPTKQIAGRLGKSDGAVRVMLTRSLARLETLLGPGAMP